jgi:hypothetical protein
LFFEKYYYLKNDKDKKFLIRNIRPLKINKKLPMILLIHGMNSLGINDPRIIHLAKSISLLGYNVITPEIPEIKNFLINQDTLKSLNDFFNIFESNLFHENISLFLISFSGGMSLIPISNNKHKKMFKSIFCIGAYSDFETSIPYTLNNFELDSYGTYILLYNYIDIIIKNNKIKNYLYDNIIFNFLNNKNYLRAKNKFSKHEHIFCDKIEKDLKFRMEISEEIIKKKKDLIKKLSPINYVYDLNLDFGIYLLHGNNDKIICKDESINIYRKINNQKKSKILTTDLINHVSSSYKIKNLSQLPKLISFFNSFFNTI